MEELTQKKTKERRAILRHPCHQSIADVAPNRNGSSSKKASFQCRIIDINNSGFRIEVEGKILADETIIQAWIPLSNPSVRVPVLSLVRWTNQKKGGISHIGLQFLF